METVEKKKTGNPNFKRKTEAVAADKTYEFELIATYDRLKPKDENGNVSGGSYPPVYGIPNKGVALDENGKQRAWRYLNYEPSIWIDQQRDIDKDLEASLLSDSDNQLTFYKGKMLIRGVEESKVKALMVQDEFEGKELQFKAGKPRVYRLLNPDKIAEAISDNLDQSYEAEKAAREASIEEVYEMALIYGLDMNQGDKAIRNDLIIQAKSNPASFLKQFVNPKNKYIYAFTKALSEGIISSTFEQGKLTWGDTNVLIMAVNSSGDVPNELASKAMSRDETVEKLFHQLAKL